MNKGIQIAISFLISVPYFIATTPQTTKNRPPIDIVYLWVDGSDPQWLAIKNQYLIRAELQSDGLTDNRFTDNEELRY